jgi:hypothetical protein
MNGFKVNNCKINHLPSAVIHIRASDNAYIEKNWVYGTTWWTTNATSAIVFAEAAGTGV